MTLLKCTLSSDRDDLSPFVVGKLYQTDDNFDYVQDNNGNEWGLTASLKHESDLLYAEFEAV